MPDPDKRTDVHQHGDGKCLVIIWQVAITRAGSMDLVEFFITMEMVFIV